MPGANTIKFIGSIDRKHKFIVYTDESYRYHQYRKEVLISLMYMLIQR